MNDVPRADNVLKINLNKAYALRAYADSHR